jgi:hypothetical protein
MISDKLNQDINVWLTISAIYLSYICIYLLYNKWKESKQ